MPFSVIPEPRPMPHFNETPAVPPEFFAGRYDINPDTGCWVWRSRSKHSNYYGVCSVEGVRHRAHRVVYTALVGPIPTGLVLDHLCRNWSCVNPDHLEAVTNQENVARGTGHTAEWARARLNGLCPNGHVLAEVGLLRPRGRNGTCAKCKRARDRECRERKRTQP